MGVNVDLTITLGSLIETGMFTLGGLAGLITLRDTVKNLKLGLATFRKDTKEDFEAVHAKIATSNKDTDRKFDGVQQEVKKLGEVLVTMARFDERITNLDRRVTSQGRQIDDLRHGDGFVRGQRSSVDGEYGS